MKTLKISIVFILLAALSGCVTSKKFKGLDSAYKKSQADDKNCNDALKTAQAQNDQLNNRASTLQAQVDDLKKQLDAEMTRWEQLSEAL